jgi:hypothetical protein
MAGFCRHSNEHHIVDHQSTRKFHISEIAQILEFVSVCHPTIFRETNYYNNKLLITYKYQCGE